MTIIKIYSEKGLEMEYKPADEITKVEIDGELVFSTQATDKSVET